jgi:D-alanyl-D-alanine endopeptidase (penicillin-binding protein 7)
MSYSAEQLMDKLRAFLCPYFSAYLVIIRKGFSSMFSISLRHALRRFNRFILSLLLTAAVAMPVVTIAPNAEAATQSQTAIAKKAAAKKLAAKRAAAKKRLAAKKKSSRNKQVAKTAAVAAAALTAAELAAQERRQAPAEIHNSVNIPLDVQSRAALIANAKTGEVLYGKNYNQTMPIASITKLMTAMVVLDAGLDMNDPVTITKDDVDTLRHTHSRLSIGTTLTRADMMLIALMASENRAAAALARSYPGGTKAAITAMNRKAAKLGMMHTRFFDGTGLNGDNISTPGDLVKLVQAAYRYADIRAFSTAPKYEVNSRGRLLQYKNTNTLVKEPEWDIGVSKTGFINEAGRCLVMMARIHDVPVVIVLMDSWGKYTRIGDANRVKQWLERVTGA